MRWVVLLGLLAGCQQIFGLSDPSLVDAQSTDSPSDTRSFLDASLRRCMGAADQLACYDFEGEARDLSATPNATTEVGLSFVGGIDGQAVEMTDASAIVIADSTLLDTDAVTIETFINPTVLPMPGARMAVWDTDGQYGLFLLPGGAITCTAGAMVSTNAGISPGTWTHVACVADGTTLVVYINGTPAGQAPATALATAPTTGAEIGGNAPTMTDKFHGRIDLLRVYRRARSAGELCAEHQCTL